MAENLFDGFKKWVFEKSAEGMMGGDGAGGDPNQAGAGNPPPAPATVPVPPDGAFQDQGQQQEMDEETSQLMEYFKANPDIIKKLGGAQAIIQALETAAKGDQAGQEAAASPEGEMKNKLESIINPPPAEQGQPGGAQAGLPPTMPQ